MEKSPLFFGLLCPICFEDLQADVEMVQHTPAISDKELRDLEMAGEADVPQHIGHERYTVEILLNSEITQELAEDYAFQPRHQEAFKRFLYLTLPADELKRYDRKDAQNLPYRREYIVAHVHLFWAAIHVVFGEAGLDSEEKIPAPELLRRVTEFVETRLDEIQRLDRRTDLSDEPIAVFRRILERFHFRLERKQVKVKDDQGHVVKDDEGNALRHMVYWLDHDYFAITEARAEQARTTNAVDYILYRECSPINDDPLTSHVIPEENLPVEWINIFQQVRLGEFELVTRE